MTAGITLVSVSAFAVLQGVNKSAAQKWEARGFLVKREGKVWVEASDRNLEHSGLGRFSSLRTGGRPPPATGHQTDHLVVEQVAGPVVATEVPRDASGNVDLDDPQAQKTLTAFVEQLLTGNYADLMTAAAVKENALALKRVLEARREAGRLIDLETAERVLFEAARHARDAWLNFPTRVGPIMAAEIGADSEKLVEALSAHVHRQLSDLGEPEADWTGEA